MIITVRVKPGSRVNEVIKEDETHYTVRVTARAVDGRANEAVIKALAGYFDCAKSSLAITSGHASRIKKIECHPER